MRLLFTAILLASVPLAASAQRRVEDAPDPYLHRGTGFVLPAEVGPFKRTSVVEYDADGSDASAGYELFVAGKSEAIVTVYVYPPGGALGATSDARCDSAFAGGRASITARFADARPLGDGTPPAPDPDARLTGRYAGYTLTADLFTPGGKVASHLYLYCPPDSRWQVKYRVSTPAETPHQAEVEALMRALAWPKTLGG
jgi:hypothetical protein